MLRPETTFRTVMRTHVHWKLVGFKKRKDSFRFYYEEHQSYSSQWNNNHLKVSWCPSGFSFKYYLILAWNSSSLKNQLLSLLGSTSCKCYIRYIKGKFICTEPFHANVLLCSSGKKTRTHTHTHNIYLLNHFKTYSSGVLSIFSLCNIYRTFFPPKLIFCTH